MAQPERYEILILGSGTGGKLVAWHMAKAGRRTAVAERRWIGGSCPNVACMPSNNEISSARVAYLVRHAASYGMKTGPAAIDMAVVRQRKRDMVEAQIAKHVQNYQASGVGSGRFVAPKTIEVSRTTAAPACSSATRSSSMSGRARRSLLGTKNDTETVHRAGGGLIPTLTTSHASWDG
jgi:pyruvate/2-oxoglutarate dehydrogenase complex dihydrolipoamide dehydrogenase (E3) component